MKNGLGFHNNKRVTWGFHGLEKKKNGLEEEKNVCGVESVN